MSYPQAKVIIDRIIYIMNQPSSHRMSGGLIHGDSNNGKTTLLDYVIKKYGRVNNLETGECRQAVLYVSAPIDCDEKLFLMLILKAVGSPYLRQNRNQLLMQVIQILTHLELKLLIIDEFHQLLDSTPSKQRTLLTTIKFLTNEVRVPIVAAGLDSAMNAVLHDPQLFNRLKPIALPLWTKSKEGIDELESLLQTFESWLPLREASDLINLEIVEKICELSGGLLGEITELLKLGAIYAIESGIEKITLDVLKHVVSGNKTFIPPRKYEMY